MKQNNRIIIYCKDPNPSGIRIILDNICEAFPDQEVQIVKTLPANIENIIIIPYGILCCYECVKHYSDAHIFSLMVDAMSLSVGSEISFYWNKKCMPLKIKLKKVLQYVYYRYLEFQVLKNSSNIMIVSPYDKHYLETRFLQMKYSSKILVIPNGVNIPDNIELKRNEKKGDELLLGVIAYWTESVLYSMKWFLQSVWTPFVKSNRKVKLIIAGRGIDTEMRRCFDDYSNIDVIGEVGRLSDFFNRIDLSLITLPKKCGILNKVLDSFAYKVPVIGMPQNFYAFEGIPDCRYEYSNLSSFKNCIDWIERHPEELATKANLAYNYVKEHHNWKANYSLIKKQVEQ